MHKHSTTRLALAQFRPVIGDLEANAERIRAYAEQALLNGASLLLCPEMALLGYPPDDLLQRQALPRQLQHSLDALARALPAELGVILGAPEFSTAAVFNAAWLLHQGQARVIARKQALPNFGVFDDRRHFSPGDSVAVLPWQGLNFALLICEDLWDQRIAGQLGNIDYDVLLVLNASPFDQGKRAQRSALLGQRSRDTGHPIVYLNMFGGQDELIFDGDTQVWTAAGKCLNRAHVPQACLLLQDFHGAEPQPALWGGGPEPAAEALLYRILCQGIRDYYRHNGFRHAYVGLSGGIDSALTLALAADALGPKNVTAVAMPSRYTAPMSLEDAAEQAARLSVAYRVLPIGGAVEVLEALLSAVHRGQPADSTEENIQARSRGTLLMALANKAGGLVLATGNKSELAVGYCTLYGDMCGGYAPLKDIYKMQVYALARWRNRTGAVIPERVITRAPSAELREDQRDEDSLPPYARLDAMLRLLIEEELAVADVIAAGFPADEVRRVADLLRGAEFKRRQAAPGPKVTVRAFGRERRYPITARYLEF